MKIWHVALNTYRGLLRNRALLALILFFLFVFLGSVGAVYFASRLAEAGADEQARLMFAQAIEQLLSTNAIFAFILAALAAAFALPAEIKSGTILPTLGCALPRSQFLLGLFLGVNLLLVTYLALVSVAGVGLMLWSGVSPEPHLLLGLLYVVLIANIVAALAFFFATFVSPFIALVATVFFLQLDTIAEGVKLLSQVWGERLARVFDYLLPAWGLLDYTAYLRFTRLPLARAADFYFTGIAHALNYLALFLLLALLTFRRRSLLPPT